MDESGSVNHVANGHTNGVQTEEEKVIETHNNEARLRKFREALGKAEGDPLRVVGVGAGAWGSVFIAMLQDTYGAFRDSIQVNAFLCSQIYFMSKIVFKGLFFLF